MNTATLNTLNPDRLTPDELGAKLGAFGSWPASGGMPEGYFTSPIGSEAGAFYREQGFIVVPDLLSRAEVEQLKAEAAGICRNDKGEIKGIDPAPAGMSDEAAMARALCIHHPQKVAQTFHAMLGHSRLTNVLTEVIGPNVKAVQSMLFLKAAGKPGQAWHQDEDYIPTRDRSLTGAWIALDDATVENGCLWVLPGSHRPGVLWPQHVQRDRRFDCGLESGGFPWDDADSVPVEVKAGGVVFFNGYLLHRSLPNRLKAGFRRSLVNHYMSAESLLPWRRPDEKTTMALADFRDIVLVAGSDPYAYKGTAEIFKAHVRVDGDGGCEKDPPAPAKA